MPYLATYTFKCQRTLSSVNLHVPCLATYTFKFQITLSSVNLHFQVSTYTGHVLGGQRAAAGRPGEADAARRGRPRPPSGIAKPSFKELNSFILHFCTELRPNMCGIKPFSSLKLICLLSKAAAGGPGEADAARRSRPRPPSGTAKEHLFGHDSVQNGHDSVQNLQCKTI